MQNLVPQNRCSHKNACFRKSNGIESFVL